MLTTLRTLLVCTLAAPLALHTAFASQTFTNPQRIPTPGGDPSTIVVGDINGDGLPDIIWSSVSAVGYHTFLSHPGGVYTAGTDVPAIPSSYGANPLTGIANCVIADFNGDGKADLICPLAYQFSEYIDVMLGNGDGTFHPGVLHSFVPPWGTNGAWGHPAIIQAVDVDGDGKLDLLAAEGNTFAGEVIYGDGAGGIRSVTSFPAISTPMQVADINHDGIADFLTSGSPGAILGHADGKYTVVTTRTHVSSDDYISGCAYADMDGDGNLDAVCGITETVTGDITGRSDLVVLHGNGDGTFNPAPLADVHFGDGDGEYDGMASFGGVLAVVDLNGDGFPDVISESPAGLTIALGGPHLTFQPLRHYASADVFFSGLAQRKLVDMNGDGLPDVVECGPNGIYISYAKHDGTYASATAPEVSEVVGYTAVGDFNGDGIPDIAATGDTAIKISLGKGDGTFAPPYALSRGAANIEFNTPLHASQAHILHGDFNGDGKQDLIAIGSSSIYQYDSYLLLGHGDGTFDDPLKIANTSDIFPEFSPIADSAVYDINHDGRSDIVSSFSNSVDVPLLQVNLAGPDGTFTTVSTKLPGVPNNGVFYDPVTQPALADFAHRNQLDAALATSNFLFVARGKGDGTFDVSSPPLPIPSLDGKAPTAAMWVAAGDFDADGNPDVAVLLSYGGVPLPESVPLSSAVWVYFGRGDGTFDAPVLAGTFDHAYSHLAAADLDNDHRDDLILNTGGSLGGGNAVGVVNSLAHRAFGSEASYTGGKGLSTTAVVDVNGDGYKDLLFTNGDFNGPADTVTLLLNQGPTPPVTGTLLASPEPSAVLSPFTVTASLAPPSAGAVLSGAISFAIDGQSIGNAPLNYNAATITAPATFSPGTHVLSATWPGDSTYSAVALNGTHVINGAPLSITLSASPNPAHVTDLLSLSTLFQPTLPSGSTPSYTGTLTFYDGATQLAQITPSTGGFTAQLTSALSAGTHTLSAVYSGDALFSRTVSNFLTLTISRWPSVSTLSAQPVTAMYGSAIDLRATVAAASSPSHGTPGGAITFSSGSTVLGSAATVNATATLSTSTLSVGSNSLSCVYAGDVTYDPSNCAPLLVIVTPADTVTTLTASPNPAYANQSISLTAAVTSATGLIPAGTVTLYDNSGATPLGNLTLDASGKATLNLATLTAGIHHLTAVYNGAPGFLTSSGAFDETVLTSDFTIQLLPPALNIKAGSDTSTQVQLTSLGNFSGPVQLTLGALPSPVTGSITPATVTLATGASATATLALHTTQRAEAHSPSLPGRPSRTLPLLALALPALLPFGRRKLRRLILVAAVTLVLPSLTGCITSYYTVQVISVGTYTIPVTGTDASGHTHTATLTLQVTP